MGTESRLASALADRYRIERELGEGGMATVYLAHDIKHDRQVAIKVLRAELAAVIGAERFLAEIKTTANLQHPHILPLFDSGTADGFLFYVMPYIEGETLRDRLDRDKQLPIAEALRIASEVAAALDYAHRRGVIHRDIKPANILLHDGSALVADFGIALAASKAGESRMTETGMSLGTPHYMSPEQAMGEREISARSDVYALGCVLYEMLLGEPPFTGPTAQSIVAKVMVETPAPLVARRARISAEVEDAVLTALEKLPADRFASAAEFAAALHAPAGARPGRHASAKMARWRDWRWAAAAGVLLGVVVTAAMLPRARPAATSFGAAGRSQLTFNGHSGRPAISPDGDYVAYIDDHCPRGTEYPCSRSMFVQERGSDRAVGVLREVPELSAPRFTSDGLSLVVSARLDSARSGLFVVPRLGGLPRRIGPAGVFDTHARADSAVLIGTSFGDASAYAHFIETASGKSTDSIALPKGRVAAVGWSPDGRWLALVEDYAKVTIVRRDGSVADSVRGPFRATVRWTPDGRGILLFRALPVKEDDLIFMAISHEGRIEGVPQVRLPATQTLLRGEFDIARRSGQLLLATGSATWDLWTFELNPAAGSPRQRTAGTTWYGSASMSADGSRIFYMRGDAVGDNLYMLTLPDSEEALTAERDPGASASRVSADGRRVLFGHATDNGSRLGILDLASRQSTFVTAEGFDTDVLPAFSKAGVVFLATDFNGLRIVDAKGTRRNLLTAPDTLRLFGYVTNPVGDSVAVVVAASGGARIGITPLAHWQPRWLYHLAVGEFSRHLSWDRSGWIYFRLWKDGDDTSALWRIRADGGPAERRLQLPAACNTSHFDIAIAAQRGACRAEDIRSDIWLVNLEGVTR